MVPDSPPLLRPRPRRPADLDPLRHFDISADNDHSEPTTPNELSPSSSSYSPWSRLTPISSNPQQLRSSQSQQQLLPDDSPAPFEAGRSRSILNLTSSTLQGIYGTADDESAAPTPGSQTPVALRSLKSSLKLLALDDPAQSSSSNASLEGNATLPQPPLDAPSFLPRYRHGFWNLILPLLFRAIILFAIGFSYGSLITCLHNSNPRFSFQDGLSAATSAANITSTVASSFQSLWSAQPAWPLLPALVVEDGQLWFRLSWGFAGILLGGLLPYLDFRLQLRDIASSSNKHDLASSGINAVSDCRGANINRRNSLQPERRASVTLPSRRTSIVDDSSLHFEDSGTIGDWNPMIRGIGVFVGIAFAIVRAILYPCSSFFFFCFFFPFSPLLITLLRSVY